MTNENSNRQMTLFLGIGIVALILGVVTWFSYIPTSTIPQPSTIATQNATLLPQLKRLPPFSLIDQAGEPFDNQRLQGQWTFLNFGYTHCPDVCPTTLAMLTNMQSQLVAQKVDLPFQVAFVSIDPERDTPERLADYMGYFDPGFLGLTGSEEALQLLTQPLGILYAKVDTQRSAMGYIMDHSASIVLIDPAGRYHALFSPPHDPQVIAEDFILISQSY